MDTTSEATDNQPALGTVAVLIDDLLNHPRITHGLRRDLRAARREIDLCATHLEFSGKVHTDIPATRVQIGGGSHLLQGFSNIDITPPADVICDVREGLPLSSGATEFIFMEHFLEHVDYPVSVKRIIGECHRVLGPGGQSGVP